MTGNAQADNNGAPDHGYVSRAGLKLAAALDAFGVDPAGKVCADLGSHVGGFVDVLLRRGARRVYAIDTAYGLLDHRLRRDSRVVVMERTNALHVQLPEPCHLVTIDVGWTRQQHILPAAARLVAEDGRIISLVKPHYEADRSQLCCGVLPEELVEPVVSNVYRQCERIGLEVLARTDSPVRGRAGNREVFLLLRPAPPTCPG